MTRQKEKTMPSSEDIVSEMFANHVRQEVAQSLQKLHRAYKIKLDRAGAEMSDELVKILEQYS